MQIKEIEALAFELLHDTGAYDLGYRIGSWTRHKTQLGVTWGPPLKLIQFSKPLMRIQEDWHVRDTILHECAHALAFEDGEYIGHGEEWKAWAVKLGAVPQAIAVDAQTIPFTWMLDCVSCGEKIGRYRRPDLARVYKHCQEVMIVRPADRFDNM